MLGATVMYASALGGQIHERSEEFCVNRIKRFLCLRTTLPSRMAKPHILVFYRMDSDRLAEGLLVSQEGICSMELAS
jgi:hypothetical protein